MTELDKIVVTIYSFIFSLPDEKQMDVLSEWWKYLERTCTVESPCVECQREQEAQRDYEKKRERANSNGSPDKRERASGKLKRKRVRWLKSVDGTAEHAAQSENS